MIWVAPPSPTHALMRASNTGAKCEEHGNNYLIQPCCCEPTRFLTPAETEGVTCEAEDRVIGCMVDYARPYWRPFQYLGAGE
jgi:hypothetical protein